MKILFIKENNDIEVRSVTVKDNIPIEILNHTIAKIFFFDYFLFRPELMNFSVTNRCNNRCCYWYYNKECDLYICLLILNVIFWQFNKYSK